MDRDYDVELLKTLGNQVNNRIITWKEASLSWFKQTGENLTDNAIAKRYRKIKEVTEEKTNNTYEYEKVDEKGNTEAMKIITLPKGEKRTPELIMKALGYDHKWHNLKWHQISEWQQSSKENGTKELYAIKYRIEPRTTPQFSPEEFADEVASLLARKVEPIKLPDNKDIEGLDKNKMMEDPGCELHLGKMSWHGDTGKDYDHKIAQKRFNDITINMVEIQKQKKCSKLVMCIGQDFFNSDTVNDTTVKGTPQQNDMRWKKMFLKGIKMYSERLATLKPYFDNIEVLYVPGNHAESTEFYLYMALSMGFSQDDVIHFSRNFQATKGMKWGINGIFWNHGDVTQKRLINSISAEFPKIWGKTLVRELHVGHLHSEKVVDEESGLILRRMSSPSGQDDWHYKERYFSLQRQQIFVWDKEKGLESIENINFVADTPSKSYSKGK